MIRVSYFFEPAGSLFYLYAEYHHFYIGINGLVGTIEAMPRTGCFTGQERMSTVHQCLQRFLGLPSLQWSSS